MENLITTAPRTRTTRTTFIAIGDPFLGPKRTKLFYKLIISHSTYITKQH